nr:NADH dehydrogenase subunit 2 [Taenianotus triacanthus]
MNPYVLATLLLGVGLGTTATFASSNWILAWMGLEMNTLAILPLMARCHHPRAIEASTKYFLTQAAGAAVLLFGTATNAWLTGQWIIAQPSHPLSLSLITLALALKMGVAPLHSWLPDVMQGVDLYTGLMLSTWQKLAPLALLSQLNPPHYALLMVLGLTSSLVGGWGGLGQTQLRKILAYSSIAHLGWFMLILPFSTPIALLTIATYIVMTSSAFLLLAITSPTSVNALATMWSKTPTIAAIVPFVLLSLAGLPPLTGFMPKWLVLAELTDQNLGAMATIMAMSALLSLYFYLRLSYATTLTLFPNSFAIIASWRTRSKPYALPVAAFVTLSGSLLPITPTLLALCSA